MSKERFDRIGYWSEIKLDIVKEYASAYSTILHAQKRPPLKHLYIDAFAGAGIHISKTKNQFVSGSPLNALLIDPPFEEYHLIDLDSNKIDTLRRITSGYPSVMIYEGDCNAVLLNEVFPRARYEDYKRALCLLDPYGLDLNWEVMTTAGRMRSVEIFLNFPVMDMNRNVLWRVPQKVDQRQVARMNAFWGDDSWRQAAYDTRRNLFGWEEKTGNEVVVEAFRERLKEVAGFRYVAEALPMRNTTGATVYYLLFAAQKPVAASIVRGIFRKYMGRSP